MRESRRTKNLNPKLKLKANRDGGLVKKFKTQQI